MIHDPALRRIEELKRLVDGREAAAAAPPPEPPPEINLTITMPPMNVYPPDVTVRPPDVNVHPTPAASPDINVQPAPVTVHVPMTPGSREVTFQRGEDGHITGARVSEKRGR